jgi:WD40 repeat protein
MVIELKGVMYIKRVDMRFDWLKSRGKVGLLVVYARLLLRISATHLVFKHSSDMDLVQPGSRQSTLTRIAVMQPRETDNPAEMSSRPSAVYISPLSPLTPDLYERAWASIPHPTLPLLATAHGKAVTVFSLRTLTKHSSLTGGHARSVRSAAWRPGLPPQQLCLVTGSFDATAGLWRWDGERVGSKDADDDQDKDGDEGPHAMEVEITGQTARERNKSKDGDRIKDKDLDKDGAEDDWEFTLVLEGHENEVKSVAFSPSGQLLATCSRDKSVWIWEDVGASEADDEWETVAVLSEHDGDVKAVAWCPDVPGRNAHRRFGTDVLASASYDNTVRVWREDNDGEWACVAVLEGHDGTVWGLEWEPLRTNNHFPRLLTFSADATIRVWTLQVEAAEDDPAASGGAENPFHRSGLGGIPNTMRRSLREDWMCTAVLPKAHTRDIYSVSWSPQSGLVASTGSDGIIAIYGETPGDTESPAIPTDGAHSPESSRWQILGTVSNGHGPYEINHVTWCKRFDPSSERKGDEEMIVSTGDDGIIRPWQVTVQQEFLRSKYRLP